MNGHTITLKRGVISMEKKQLFKWIHRLIHLKDLEKIEARTKGFQPMKKPNYYLKLSFFLESCNSSVFIILTYWITYNYSALGADILVMSQPLRACSNYSHLTSIFFIFSNATYSKARYKWLISGEFYITRE